MSGGIELQQRLTAGADDKSSLPVILSGAARGSFASGAVEGPALRAAQVSILRPGANDAPFFSIAAASACRRKFSAAGTIGVGKIRIAELADGRRAVGFASRPEIAARKAAEDRGASGLRTLALQRVEDFFDRVHKSSFSAFSSGF